jgi:two-component system, LytTR family, response regulator LytT
MRKIVIVEDEPDLARNIAELITLLGYTVSGIFNNSKSCLLYLSKNQVDLVILDILIKGEENGIELGKTIAGSYNIPILFCSAYTDELLLQKVKSINPRGYIVKPFTREILKTNIFLALNDKLTPSSVAPPNNDKDTFHIRDKGYVIPVEVKDILMAEADGLYTKIITSDKSYLIRAILKNIEAQLPQNKFLRVHKSYLVNLDHISSFNSKGIKVNNNNIVPVRRGYYKSLKELFSSKKDKVY